MAESASATRSYHVPKKQVVKASMILAARNFVADPQWIIPSIIAPFIFTMVALFFYAGASNGGASALLSAVLGGGLMGVWGTTVYGSANSIGFDRWNGTMESTLVAPAPLIWIVLGRVLWNTFIGVINGFVVLAIGLVWFRVGMVLVSPMLFVLATVLTYVSMSAFGLVLSTVYVLSRKGGFIENSMEIPVYIATGTSFAVALLPLFVLPVSYVLGPTWGIEAIKRAAVGSAYPYGRLLPTGYWTDIAFMLIATLGYFVLSFALFGRVEVIAKRNGTIEEY
ncbi:MAG: ABC transporter permease [Thaumarchaeota archaeon]|nr:ABC transporter permease [Nitrososphaerota archaeon]